MYAGSNCRKWRLGQQVKTSIKIINQLNVNLFQQNVDFQSALSISTFYFLVLAKLCQFSNKTLFHSFIVKSNIFLAIPTFYFQVLFKFLSIFQHSIIFLVKSNAYFNNSSIIFPSFIQVCLFSVLCYFIPSKGNITFSSTVNSYNISICTIFSTLSMGNCQENQGA